ncbi:hypothetical protein FSP39_000178 [Pinctada imbricata]|uniref:FAM20 C-terminal domain-containing protein n=1 Tax=Pinctada imbricata TaxID=66713 RepID=A0AA89BY42_PINIB|nr:hypothetical protein FSP39_000178 [Pinctada imbricata]
MRKLQLWKVAILALAIVWLFVSYKILLGSKYSLHSNAANEDRIGYLQDEQSKKDNSDSVVGRLGGDNQDFKNGNWTMRDAVIAELKSKYRLNFDFPLQDTPWEVAAQWVKQREIHPEYAPELGSILHALATQKIVSADFGIKGTQLKMSVILEGGQMAIFKPKWFSRDHVIKGSPYGGADRHNGEIAAFHLIRLLEFRRAPLVVGRRVSMKKEIMPVATDRLLQTFYSINGSTCFYGRCYYCKDNTTGVCADGDIMEGALVMWLPKQWKLKMYKHPWARSYHKGKLARWEKDPEYCDKVKVTEPYHSGPRLMDLVDTCIIDYLVGNADRHLIETLGTQSDSMVTMIDNGKSFGNPNHDEFSILAPLYQCCRIRYNTWEKLLIMQEGVLSQVLRSVLKQDPISPVISEPHLQALDRRLKTILEQVQACLQKNPKNVLVKDDL